MRPKGRSYVDVLERVSDGVHITFVPSGTAESVRARGDTEPTPRAREKAHHKPHKRRGNHDR